jgi:hypothetical protein
MATFSWRWRRIAEAWRVALQLKASENGMRVCGGGSEGEIGENRRKMWPSSGDDGKIAEANGGGGGENEIVSSLFVI